MNEERPQQSEPIRVDDYSQAPQPAPSTRGSVRDSNPAVAANTTLPGEQDISKVAEKHRAAHESAQRHAQQIRQDQQQALADRERLSQMASQDQSPPQSSPEQLASQIPPQNQPQQLETDLSLLVTRGKIEDETIVGGYRFVLRTLTSKENASAMSNVSYIADDWARLSHMSMTVLARAIVTVNGVALENLYQGADADKLTSLEKREEIVGAWQQGLVGQLFKKYGEMTERSNNVFDNGDLKN